MQKYFDAIDKEVKNAHHVSSVARKKGYDPEEEVNIPLAKGISERVEGLISAVSPKILNSGVAQRILELEKKYGSLDWRVALKISEEVVNKLIQGGKIDFHYELLEKEQPQIMQQEALR